MPEYLITTSVPLAPPDDKEKHVRERLVRAKNQAQALQHVVGDTITVKQASIEDAMRLAAKGVTLETAEAA